MEENNLFEGVSSFGGRKRLRKKLVDLRIDDFVEFRYLPKVSMMVFDKKY